MPVYTVQNEPDLTVPEGKIVRAKLMEVRPHEIEWTIKNGPNQGKKASKVLLNWWWELQDEAFRKPDGDLRRIKGQCEAYISNHSNNKFHTWAEALLRREIPLGMPIDTDDLTGLQADIIVFHRADKNDPSRVYEEVSEVIGVETFEDSSPPF